MLRTPNLTYTTVANKFAPFPTSKCSLNLLSCAGAVSRTHFLLVEFCTAPTYLSEISGTVFTFHKIFVAYLIKHCSPIYIPKNQPTRAGLLVVALLGDADIKSAKG